MKTYLIRTTVGNDMTLMADSVQFVDNLVEFFADDENVAAFNRAHVVGVVVVVGDDEQKGELQ